MRLRADVTLLIVAVIWGSAFAAQRVAAQLGSVYFFNGWRYLLAALVVSPFVGRIKISSLSVQQYEWMFVAGFLLFVGSALQQAGMLYTTAGNAGFISSLYVVLTPIVLVLFWKEKPHWISLVSVILAGLGTFLLSTGGKFEVRAGDALELAGALLWTFHVIVLGKFASRFDALSFSVGQLFICGVLNFGLGIIAEGSVPFNWSLIIAIIYTAFLSLGLCYTLQIWAQRHTPPEDAALILSLESVFAVLSGWLLLHEQLIPIQILGCFLIFTGVILSQTKGWGSSTIDKDHLIEGR